MRQYGGMIVPDVEDIIKLLYQYTESQIKEDPILSALKDRLKFASRNIEQVARVAHAAEREYAQSLNDFSIPEWINARPEHRIEVANHVVYVDTHPNASPSLLYETWHPGSEFSELSKEEQFKYYLFRHIVRAFREI